MSAGATGVGSLPGGDAREAAKTATGSFEDFPYLPELPARGPGADMIGRSIGLLVDMYGHVEPSGWRISDRPGRDTRRARSWLGEDLDALEEFTQGYTGRLKVQAVGPWTLAAALELHGGEAMLQDAGACRDLAGSLAEGLREHLADVRKRIPGAEIVLQLDEPSLTAVLLGRVRSASGYRTYRAVDRQVVEGALRDLFAVHDGEVIVHSCAPEVPFGLLRRAGATGVSFDFSLLTEREDDAVGEAVEGGTKLFAGVVPGTDGPLSDPGGSVMGVRKLWRRLGLAPGTLAESVVVTPSCGLAGASPAYARAAQAHCVRAARSLADNPE
ncbi:MULTISPECIES: methionine synthase [Streptomyces]|uniref:Cobalamin-independent methionine synthase MetE C-terminal/archaeal domain-containing protein n=1 Tax=Streptomyces virginiae TaxID=1961 RepID=A0ABQ3NF04_STRVG|nr:MULTISPECIES: methionine synthase [Streptomyces]KOU81671.1 methionine synthase [Streptomyces sp. XY593]KOU92763.1 methionine synthase [Streptomyces sp. XY533]MBP2346673.1 methionine synthase II (cobalamin-independent) [Streptomyces virginiae]MCI4083896.1 methionine synthase [Streptomyces sp. MMS21 TC-5]RST13602.1 methionine synthase [Streptomyces sp. WAC05950]